jgi:hypothetical protein
MSGSTRSYRFGAKNHWRRTVWNDVLSRTNRREKREPVLYLAGPDDADRPVAVSKGVPALNLIAIDYNKANAEAVRKRGYPALHAQAVDVLWSWPEHRPSCAVLLDLCCGLERSTVRMLTGLCRSPFSGAVVMVNQQRGRDPNTNWLRAHWSPVLADLGLNPLHRGAMCYFSYLSRIISSGTQNEQEIERRAIAFLLVMQPKFYEYQSDGGMMFDSVVWSMPNDMPESSESLRSVARHPRTARRMSAMFAIRTMRQEGTL